MQIKIDNRQIIQ